ncbi:MAG: hypothetical protein AAF267_05020, partial [Deinococcota bacterium]
MIAILCVVVSALFSLQPSPLQPSPSVETGGLPNRSLSPVSKLPVLELERSNTSSEFHIVGKNLPANQTGTFTLTNALGDAFSYVFITSAEGDVDSIQYIFAEADNWEVRWQVADVSGMTRLVWEGEPAGLELNEAPVTSPATDTSSVDTVAPEVSSPEPPLTDTSPEDAADALAVTETPDVETPDVELQEPASSLADEASDETSLAVETSVENTPTEAISTEATSTEEPLPTETPTDKAATTETASPEPLTAEETPSETASTETTSDATTETPTPVVSTPPAWLVALGRSSWHLTFAVVLAIIALRLTLLCKYWVAQSEDIEAYWREHKRVPKLARLNIMNYFSVAEKLTLLGLFGVALLLAILAHWEDGGFATSLNTTLQQAVRNPWAALASANPPQLASLVWQVALGVFFVAAVIHLVGLVLPRPERARAPQGTPLYGLFSVLIPGSALAARGYGILL